MLFGGIEAGGTKFVCAVGTGPDDIKAETRCATGEPEETLAQALEFFRKQEAVFGKLTSIGIGSFGPVDPDPESPTWGYVTMTPKLAWVNTDFAQRFRQEFGIPVGFDTDVNAAALGEWQWGAAKGLDTFLYLTIGTGIGGGGLVGGRIMHGLIHPEMGHIRIPHDLSRDPYGGNCPYHGDCFEGLASGPAIGERWNVPASELPEAHSAWKLEAEYIAYALVNFICTLSPQVIILGGGVMEQKHLFPAIRNKVVALLNSYIHAPSILSDIDGYIVPPALGNRAGVLGSFVLAKEALESRA